MDIEKIKLRDFREMAIASQDGHIKIGDITFKGLFVLKIDGHEGLSGFNYDIAVRNSEGNQETLKAGPNDEIDAELTYSSSTMTDAEVLAMIRKEKQIDEHDKDETIDVKSVSGLTKDVITKIVTSFGISPSLMKSNKKESTPEISQPEENISVSIDEEELY